MNTNVILSKDSSPSEIERYFRGVLALDQQDKVFSVNLDDVYQLAYVERGKAISSLKNNFIENVDYIVIAQSGKNPQGGRPKIDYYLTSAAMEYFVARKVRPVFEVYRRVFHHVANNIQQQSASLNEQIQANLTFADWTIKTLNLNDASKIAWAKKISDKFGLAAELPSVVNAGTANPVLHAASDLLKERNVGISAQAFNRMLELKGVVRKATRPGRFGKIHKWFVINPDYDRFGQNQQDPKYQQQTQARWYDNLFDELLGIVGISKQAIIDLK